MTSFQQYLRSILPRGLRGLNYVIKQIKHLRLNIT
jgi:hypothetical protein